MSRDLLIMGILAGAALLCSCSSKPTYDEENPNDVDAYYKAMQSRVEVSKPLPEKNTYKEYEGTKLDLVANRDYNATYPYTPFVTKYDPDTRVNVGPGHVPEKTKWCPICKQEVSISEQDPHFHWEENGKQMSTRYSYLEDREVGANHVYKKTKFSREAKREIVVEDYDAEKTKWCPVCMSEAGEGHDHDFTRYCPTCQVDVARYGHEQKGEIHYGHVCGLTLYSPTWMVDMFRKEAKIYEKIPASRIDYQALDKAYAPDRAPRIRERAPSQAEWEARPQNTMLEAFWVEDRKVLPPVDFKLKWSWRNPEAEKMTFELAKRVVGDVAKEDCELAENARNPEYKWTREEKKK